MLFQNTLLCSYMCIIGSQIYRSDQINKSEVFLLLIKGLLGLTPTRVLSKFSFGFEVSGNSSLEVQTFLTNVSFSLEMIVVTGRKILLSPVPGTRSNS